MAISLVSIRSGRQTSIYGRRLALARQSGVAGAAAEEYLVGMNDVKRPVTELSSGSTGTSISPSAVTNINVTSAATTATGGAFLLSNPQPGVSCFVGTGVSGTTSTQGSTAIALIRPSANVAIESSEGSTMAAILLAYGNVVRLLGMSTARYKVVARSGAVTLTGTT